MNRWDPLRAAAPRRETAEEQLAPKKRRGPAPGKPARRARSAGAGGAGTSARRGRRRGAPRAPRARAASPGRRGGFR